MTGHIVIAGTDTNVGKTVFAAALTGALQASYWKPIQAGLDGETDSSTVRRLADVPENNIQPEAYRLKTPASPHLAAAIDGVTIDTASLNPPPVVGPLVIETAGGLLVPLAPKMLQAEVIAYWKLPVVLVASTRLGTINHALLSIEALKRRAIPILGVAFSGPEAPGSMRAVAEFGGVRVLGRMPYLDPLDAKSLREAFAANFNVAHILGLGEGGP